MEQITSHKVAGLNDGLTITADDEPGPGGACHEYSVEYSNHGFRGSSGIKFQKGPISEAGFNGVSNEALLAIVEHRLMGFQSGGFACRENAIALTKIQEATHWLHHRTRQRMQRGVEGTSEK